MSFPFIALEPQDREHLEWVAALWNNACNETMPVSAGFVEFNVRPMQGVVQAGRFAVDDAGRPVGVVLASAHPGAPAAMESTSGWIDLIAVATPFQRQAIGSELLQWAEVWLAEQGCRAISVGGSLRPFLPGVPVDLRSEPFFVARGYSGDAGAAVWDLAHTLSAYIPPAGVETTACAVRPAQPRQTDALLAFLAREFPGRWLFECRQFLADGGRVSDYMLLWTEAGVQGTCRLTFEDSVWPIERFYPYQLPRPWGQLGSIGIAGGARGRGFGLALLDGGLRRLHNNGVNGCVIDWTSLLDFYAKVGFSPYRQYRPMGKHLA